VQEGFRGARARRSPLCHSCHWELFAHDTLAGLSGRRAFSEGIRFTLGVVLTLCLGITARGPTVGLTLSTTSVFDTGGGDVSMVTIKMTHWLSQDASGVLSIGHDDDVQQQRAWHDEHAVQERA